MATSTAAAALISSTAQLKAFLTSIAPSSTLYLDLEGNSLCRYGTISLITILLHLEETVKLIDVLSFGKSAFTTTSGEGQSLKFIIEGPIISKCLGDVGHDADALWALYQVGLAGVVDIQLLENACRNSDRPYLCGLEKAIQCDQKLGPADLDRWTRLKMGVKRPYARQDLLCSASRGGKTAWYCMNDVVYLPRLHALYLKRITGDWRMKAEEESTRRMIGAHSSAYEPHSPMKTLGPWGPRTGRLTLSLDVALEEMEDRSIEKLLEDVWRR